MIWRKSSYSETEDKCVEVALGLVTHIRDTKDRSGGTLEVPTRSWAAFVTGLWAPSPQKPDAL